jgi:signal transduction histidine kinase
MKTTPDCLHASSGPAFNLTGIFMNDARKVKGGAVLLGTAVVSLFLACCLYAFAFSPAPDKIQYPRTAWRGNEQRSDRVPSVPLRRYPVVMSAAYDSGMRNDADDYLEFAVPPGFYQAGWFSALCAAGLIALLVSFYQLRLRQMSRQFNIRLENYTLERNRVARELHDTLLQGFMSASMQLQVAADLVTPDSAAKPLLGRVLQIMADGIDDGRKVISGLRSSNNCKVDLEHAFSRILHELDPQKKIRSQIIVKGRPRPMRAAIRDEVYWIGREALVNTFRHSQAKNVEIELEYGPCHLRLLVRDDGCGIDRQVIRSGRRGHWGLAGMRERAAGIVGRIVIRNGQSAGTEVDLLVPGNTAFQVRYSVIHAWQEWFVASMDMARRQLRTGEQQ